MIKEKIKEYRDQWRKDNPEKVRKIQKKYDKKRYEEIRQYLDNYKLSKGCAICGYNKCVAALEFHHEGDKEFEIAGSTHRNLERLKREIEKCTVICANCHRELHQKEKK